MKIVLLAVWLFAVSGCGGGNDSNTGTGGTGGTGGGGGGTPPPTPLTITPATLANCCRVNVAFSVTFAANGTAPYTWAVASGAIPAGLTLNASTGVLSGTPTAAAQGNATFTIGAADSSSPQRTGSQAFTVTVGASPSAIVINNTQLPFATNAVAYAGATLVASGGIPPYTWTIVPATGSLPTGIAFSTGGVFGGTPTQTGLASFSVQVMDSANQVQQAAITLNVLPELPRVHVDTTMPVQTGNTSTFFGAGGTAGLQIALNIANCGDTIRLHAGDTFVGNLVLPDHNCGASNPPKWIVIESDSASLPAAGTRATPTDAPNMPKLVTAVANLPALAATNVPTDPAPANTKPAGNYYRLIGLEITFDSVAITTAGNPAVTPQTSGSFTNAVLQFGNVETSSALQPHHIVVDRCFIHGTPNGELRRGVAFQGSNLAIIDSTINEIHQTGNDTQAIGGWNGPGPYLIKHNRLEASGENILFGGAPGTADLGTAGVGPTQSPIVPSDIEIINNYFFKPLRWKYLDPAYNALPGGGIPWAVKNLLEIKNAQRVLLDGNIFENNWNEHQTGHAIVNTPRSEGGVMANARNMDFTYRNNILLHAGSGFSNIATDSTEGTTGPVRGANIAFLNNLLIDMNSTPVALTPAAGGGFGSGEGGDWRIFGDCGSDPSCPASNPVGRGMANVTIDHNTGLGDSRFLNCNGGEKNSPGFVMSNNVVNFGELTSPNGPLGNKCGGVGIGTASLTDVFPGFIFDSNVIAKLMFVSPTSFPANNFFPSDFVAAGMVDISNCNAGLFDPSKCGLTITSQFHNAGNDGKDIGVDITKLPLTGVKP